MRVEGSECTQMSERSREIAQKMVCGIREAEGQVKVGLLENREVES